MTASVTSATIRRRGSDNADRPYPQIEHALEPLRMDEDKKLWMKQRWLDQVRWFDQKAEAANRRHVAFRVIAITGGVLIPPLVSVSPGGSLEDVAHALAFGLSLLVAGAIGLDEFFHWGERWRHFRRSAELLKTEGWLFIEGGGRYGKHQHRKNFHDRLFPFFATKVEEIIRRDVEVYLTRIVQEGEEDRERDHKEMERLLGEEDSSPHEAEAAVGFHRGQSDASEES
jgi:hypothetical protein